MYKNYIHDVLIVIIVDSLFMIHSSEMIIRLDLRYPAVEIVEKRISTSI